jgi:predicted aspartyl protease
MLGNFDSTGSPVFRCQVSDLSGAKSQEVTAVMDTGFSGFLLLPISLALPLDLVPYGSLDVTLADGTTQSKLICDGAISFEGLTHPGLFILEEQGAEVLAGMAFLKTFALTLIINTQAMSVELTRT